MPLITALEPDRAGGFILHVDGEPVCRVSDGLRLRLRLIAGEEITASRVREVVHESGIDETREVALRYLSHRPRTRMEVLRHLRGKGLGAHAEMVVSRCEELGYIDDGAYALAFARERIRLKPRGRPRLVSELLSRGVDRETAERAAAAALEQEGVTEDELLRSLALRRLRSLARLDPAVTRRRLTGFLRRRGFQPSAVRTVVEELLSGREDDSTR